VRVLLSVFLLRMMARSVLAIVDSESFLEVAFTSNMGTAAALINTAALAGA